MRRSPDCCPWAVTGRSGDEVVIEGLTFNHGAATTVRRPRREPGQRDVSAPALRVVGPRGASAPAPFALPVVRPDIAYWGACIFTVLLFFRPQDTIPVLAPLHLSEITAVVALIALGVSRVSAGQPDAAVLAGTGGGARPGGGDGGHGSVLDLAGRRHQRDDGRVSEGGPHLHPADAQHQEPGAAAPHHLADRAGDGLCRVSRLHRLRPRREPGRERPPGRSHRRPDGQPQRLRHEHGDVPPLRRLHGAGTRSDAEAPAGDGHRHRHGGRDRVHEVAGGDAGPGPDRRSSCCCRRDGSARDWWRRCSSARWSRCPWCPSSMWTRLSSIVNQDEDATGFAPGAQGTDGDGLAHVPRPAVHGRRGQPVQELQPARSQGDVAGDAQRRPAGAGRAGHLRRRRVRLPHDAADLVADPDQTPPAARTAPPASRRRPPARRPWPSRRSRANGCARTSPPASPASPAGSRAPSSRPSATTGRSTTCWPSSSRPTTSRSRVATSCAARPPARSTGSQAAPRERGRET